MTPLPRPIKFLLSGFSLLAGVLAVSYLQKRFDEADGRKAVEALLLKYPRLHECRVEMISRWRGEVRVHCGGDPQGVWRVDVTQGVIQEETP